MSSSRRNLALAASAAFAVWLQFLGGPLPLHALVAVVLTVVVGAAVTWRSALTGLRPRVVLGLLSGTGATGAVLVLTRPGSEARSALVAVLLAVGSAALLGPVRQRVRLRDRLAAALDDGTTAVGAAPAAAGPVDASPITTTTARSGAVDAGLSLQVLQALSVDLPGGDRRTAPAPVTHDRRAVL